MRLYETLAGFALSIAVGTPLAVMLVYSPVLSSGLYPLRAAWRPAALLPSRGLTAGRVFGHYGYDPEHRRRDPWRHA